jgi:hypothetical protein
MVKSSNNNLLIKIFVKIMSNNSLKNNLYSSAKSKKLVKFSYSLINHPIHNNNKSNNLSKLHNDTAQLVGYVKRKKEKKFKKKFNKGSHHNSNDVYCFILNLQQK